MHRRITAESLCDDFVMLIMVPPSMMKHEDVQRKMEQLWDIVSRYEADITNFGTVRGGGRHKKPVESFKKIKRFLIHAVFKDREHLRACLQDITNRDLKVSVTVSGCLEEVRQTCTEVDLKPHTIQYSLGLHGRRERLPDEKILDVATMCGHAMVSPNLIAHFIEKIGQGKLTHAKAAETLSRMCDCGIFNPRRAERLLRQMA